MRPCLPCIGSTRQDFIQRCVLLHTQEAGAFRRQMHALQPWARSLKIDARSFLFHRMQHYIRQIAKAQQQSGRCPHPHPNSAFIIRHLCTRGRDRCVCTCCAIRLRPLPHPNSAFIIRHLCTRGRDRCVCTCCAIRLRPLPHPNSAFIIRHLCTRGRDRCVCTCCAIRLRPLTHSAAGAAPAAQTVRSGQSARHRCRPPRSCPFPDR